MAITHSFALRIPASLMKDVEALATQNAVSVNQFLVQAAAEKVAALKARDYLEERAARATPGDLGRILAEAERRLPLPAMSCPRTGRAATTNRLLGSAKHATLE